MKIKEISGNLRQDKMAYLMMTVYLFILSYAAIFSESSYGGGDSWLHYQMAHFAFKHPLLFLDQWGKPLYTMIACLPARAGFIGIKFFNIGCSMIVALLVYRMAKHQFEKFQWLAVVFVLSVPIYFVTLFSGLTESVFALFLMSSVYLFHIYRVKFACLIISFLPFIRSEGFLFIPLFAALCMYYRRWVSLPFLCTGFLVFTFIGYFCTGSWNWVLGTNLYLNKATYYGSGPWYYFFKNHSATFGWAYTVFMTIAIVAFFQQGFRDIRNREFHIQFVLLFGGLVLYFSAHSYFWYKGIFGSAGLLRVMAGVGPCIGYTAFCGFQFLLKYTEGRFQRWKKIVLTSGVIWIFIMPRYVYTIPVPFTELQKLEKKALDYLSENKLDHTFLYYQDPFFLFEFDKDPFDDEIAWNLYRQGEKPFKPHSIVLWDSHLCPVESLLPLNVMENHPVELIKRFAAADEYNKKDTMEVRIYLTK